MKRKTAYQKATQRIQTDGIKHCTVLYGATAIVLWRHYGKRGQAITNLFDLSRKVWRDCAKDHDHSMIQMCETETGIEIQNGDGSEWRDLWYLNGHIPENMTYEQALYMRQQQIKWIRPQVMACLMIALHRKYGFGFERCARIYQQIEEAAQEYRSEPKRIRKACMEMTGIDVLDIVTKKGQKDDSRGICEDELYDFQKIGEWPGDVLTKETAVDTILFQPKVEAVQPLNKSVKVLIDATTAARSIVVQYSVDGKTWTPRTYRNIGYKGPVTCTRKWLSQWHSKGDYYTSWCGRQFKQGGKTINYKQTPNERGQMAQLFFDDYLIDGIRKKVAFPVLLNIPARAKLVRIRYAYTGLKKNLYSEWLTVKAR